MNLFQGAVVLAAAAGGIYFFARPAPADEYPMAMRDVYSRLATVTSAADMDHREVAAFGGHSITPSGNGTNLIVWRVGKSAPVECTMQLTALAEAKTKVALSCDEAASTKAMNAQNRLMASVSGPEVLAIRNDSIEMIDSTLKGQAFDPKQTSQIAFMWPDDVVHHDNLIQAMPKMQGAAIQQAGEGLKMEAEQERAQNRAELARNTGHGDSSYSDGTPTAAWTPPPGPANPWGH